MNSFRHRLADAVRTHNWNAIHPGMEQKVVCTVGTVTTLGSSVYLGYSMPHSEYPIASALLSLGLSVGAGTLAAVVSFVPSVALSGIPIFTAIGAGRMLKDYRGDHMHIHAGK